MEDWEADGDEVHVLCADVLVDVRGFRGPVFEGVLLPWDGSPAGDGADRCDGVRLDRRGVQRAAEDVEVAEVARVLLGHVVVEGRGDWEHDLEALLLCLAEDELVHALGDLDPQLRPFHEHAAGHGDEVHGQEVQCVCVVWECWPRLPPSPGPK